MVDLRCKIIFLWRHRSEKRRKHPNSIITLLRPLGRIRPKRIHLGIPLISPRRGAFELACIQQTVTHCGMHASIFSHTWTTRGAGSLVYVRVGSGRFLAGEDICGATDHFQRFWNDCGRKRVIQLLRRPVLNNPLTPIGSNSTQENSPRNSLDFAAIAGAFELACMQHDTLRHACIDFFTYLNDQGSRQSGLCPSRERSVPGRRGHMWGYRSFPAVLKRLRA